MPYAIITLLFVVSFSLGTVIHGWYLAWEGNRADASNMLVVLLGDSRRMFASYFFAKADVYFHSGYYPSIFDNREAFQTAHMAEDAEMVEWKNTGDEHEFLGDSHDWIDRFGRHFFPSEHTHLDDGGACKHHDHRHEEQGEHGGGLEREILPWLWMSARLDPQRIETYTVASYWICERLGNVDEAERFLMEGLRENPSSYEILFEIGRI